MSKIIDLAKWNKVNDYSKIKAAGVDGAIVKVINSSNKTESSLETHVYGLRAAGVPVVGGYHYTYANTIEKAAVAAMTFIENAVMYGIDMLWLDLEDAVMTNLGSLLIDIVDVYKNIIENAGLKFGIYTGASFYNTYFKKYAQRLIGIPFWIARYPVSKEYSVQDETPDIKYLPSGFEVYGWQYTSKCKINGIVGYVDLSEWYRNEPVSLPATVIPTEQNPYTEPITNIMADTSGNNAFWVEWYLWRFGLYLDNTGIPDQTMINGFIDALDVELIKEAQRRLGIADDGIVGKVTRAQFKKACQI